MKDRRHFEQLLRELYASRVDADLERLCRLFASDAHLRIVGTSDGKPITIAASGIEQIRTWLAMLVKTFELANYEIVSMLIDGERAAVHWRVDIRSKITGVAVPTELVDLVEARDAGIASYTELFFPG